MHTQEGSDLVHCSIMLLGFGWPSRGASVAGAVKTCLPFKAVDPELRSGSGIFSIHSRGNRSHSAWLGSCWTILPLVLCLWIVGEDALLLHDMISLQLGYDSGVCTRIYQWWW